MDIQKVSFKNNLLEQANQQNKKISAVMNMPSDDYLKSSNKKQKTRIKNTSILASIAMLVVLAANYRKISTLFNKRINQHSNTIFSEKTNIVKNEFIPANQLLDVFGKPFVTSKKYEHWHFTSGGFLKKFIQSHDDIHESYIKTKLPEHGLWNLKVIKDFNDKGIEEVVSFVSKVREKIGVDLSDNVKHYRFIGKSELDVLKKRLPVENKKHNHIYVSLCPEAQYDVPPYWDYRVTFKNTNNIQKNMGGYHDSAYKSTINGPYYPSDVETVEKLVDGKWQKVNLDDNEKIKSRVMAIPKSK